MRGGRVDSVPMQGRCGREACEADHGVWRRVRGNAVPWEKTAFLRKRVSESPRTMRKGGARGLKERLSAVVIGKCQDAPQVACLERLCCVL